MRVGVRSWVGGSYRGREWEWVGFMSGVGLVAEVGNGEGVLC